MENKSLCTVTALVILAIFLVPQAFADNTITNNPPILAGIPDIQVQKNSLAQTRFDLWPYAIDTEDTDDRLSFEIINQIPSSPVNCSIDSGHYVLCSAPTANTTGYNDVTVRVMDLNNATATDTFRITVYDTSAGAPTFTSLPNINIRQNSGSRSDIINLFDYTSDPQNTDEQLTFSIPTQTNQNLINCFIHNDQYISCDPPRAGQTGQSTLTVKAANTSGLFSTASAIVNVNSYSGNRTAPSISGLGTYEIEENSGSKSRIIDLYDYARDSEDSDSQLTYRILSQSYNNLIFCRIIENRYISCDAPRNDDTGTSDIVIQVEDQDGQLDDDTLTIEVTSDGSGRCSDITILTETVYMDEDDTDTVTFSIRNRGDDDFTIDDIQTSDNSQYISIVDEEYDDLVESDDETDLDLEIDTSSTSIDRDATGYIEISGEFDDGTSCSFNDIGKTSFRVRVDGGGSSGSSSSACSDIELEVDDIEIPEGRTTAKEFRITNDSSRDFEIDDIEVSESSSDFTARVSGEPSSVDSDDSETIKISFEARSVSRDRTDTAKLRVSGEFSNGKSCSLSTISESFDVTVEDTSSGSGSDSETPEVNLDNIAFSTSPQMVSIKAGESRQVSVSISNSTGKSQCFSLNASDAAAFATELSKTSFCLANGESDYATIKITGKKEGTGTSQVILTYADKTKSKPISVEVQDQGSQPGQQLSAAVSAPAEIAGTGKITVENTGKDLRNVKIKAYNLPEGIEVQSMAKDIFNAGEKAELEVKTGNFKGKAEGLIRIESDSGIRNIPLSFEAKESQQPGTGTGLLNLAVMAGTGIVLLIILALAIAGIVAVFRRK